jgi:hypothetical protein
MNWSRVQALPRRPPGSEDHVLATGNESLGTESRIAMVAGRGCPLPSREAEVLEILLKRNGLVVSLDVFRGQVFGRSQHVSSNAIGRVNADRVPALPSPFPREFVRPKRSLRPDKRQNGDAGVETIDAGGLKRLA